jgi:hypothetical protein
MIEAGAGLVVGTVSADGEPRATRAWAATVVDADARRVRVAIGADDEVAVENLAGGALSLTGADVTTFRSVQMKGHVVAVESPTAEDVDLVRLQSGLFFGAVHATDGNPHELLRRILPHEVIVVEMIVEEMFDQTPGPEAGSRIGSP